MGVRTPTSSVGVKGRAARIAAQKRNSKPVVRILTGLPALKEEASLLYQGIRQCRQCRKRCVPVSRFHAKELFASFLTCSQCDEKDTILFIDPGFPHKKQQLVVMGQKYETFDVYDYRGCKLSYVGKLFSYVAIVYYNPQSQLDMLKSFHAPYQPSSPLHLNSLHTAYIGSKAFSYAGQRIGGCISKTFYHRAYPGLTQRYGGGTFGWLFIHRVPVRPFFRNQPLRRNTHLQPC